MEEYLRDSPSELVTGSFNTPNSTANGYNNATTAGVNEREPDNLMLNVGQSVADDPSYQVQQSVGVNGDFLSLQFLDNQYNDTSQPGSFHEPFLDDFNALEFPQTNQYDVGSTSKLLALGQGQGLGQLQSQNTFSQFFNPTNANTLDDIISPNSNSTSLQLSNNAYLNPQYFSPNTNPTYGNLNSIPEDNFNLSPSLQEPFSGPGSFNGPDILSGTHLSPQGLSYVSPSNYDNSLDTLRSPPVTSGSYLNSPPQFQPIRNNPIPIKEELTGSNALSPPIQQHLMSPTSSSLQSRDTSTKQLTKEEKLKRRRDFHNQVERRRRDLIKEKIKTLGQIVPVSLLNPPLCAVQTLQAKASTNSQELNDLISSVKVKETKPNKSTILNRSVDYIRHLNYVIEKQEQRRNVLLTQIEEAQRVNGSSVQMNTSSLSSMNDLNPGQIASPSDQDPQQDYFNPDEFFLATKEFY